MKHPYTVKNYLWLVIITMFVVLALLSGCSSTPPKKTAQFCNTSQTVEVQNGKQVDSKTVVKCSDDFLDRHVPARAGVDRNCQETINQYVLNGRVVERRGIACETHRPGRIIYIPDPQNM
jgi:hypothetical protein